MEVKEFYKAGKRIAQAKILGLKAGRKIIVINEEEAKEMDIYAGQRVGIKIRDEEFVAIVDVSSSIVKKGEVGIFEDYAEEIGVKEGDFVEVFLIPTPMSIEAIRKKIFGVELSNEEVFSIISDLMENKLSEPEIAAFIVSSQIRGLSDKEVVSLIQAMVSTGDKIEIGKHPVVDKHCIGGVAGNRTTMILVPIVAAAGLYIPKTSSRAITSPAGTADTMEVLADVEFSAQELKEIVLKTRGAIVWGGSVNIAPADDHMIRIRRSLNLDPRGLLLSSILAKKLAVSSEYVIIDIPVGRGAKIEETALAKDLGKYFKTIGSMIGMNVGVVLTDGSSPIGFGIGPGLEARDVIRVLRNSKDLPLDLKKKGVMLAGKLLEMSGKVSKGDGFDVALHILESGKAWKKMQEIIEAQGGNPDVKEEDLPLGEHVFELKAVKEGKIEHIDNKAISKVARASGAPKDKGSGIELFKTKGDRVKKGEVILKIYSESSSKLTYAIKALETFQPIKMEKILIEEML